MRLTIPTLFGLEGLAAEELRRLNVAGVAADNARVSCDGGPAEIARINLGLRTGERVLIELGRFPAKTFDDLFEGTKALPWENIIPGHGAFPVKGYSINSQLSSEPACQSIIKKAVAERLGRAYGFQRLPEDGPLYQIQFSLLRDEAALFLDTSGKPLHQRGYREDKVLAPLRETLAAAMVQLLRYRGRDWFCDPMCGSGTIVIEAAMIARNIAPGLNRHFACESWGFPTQQVWQQAREEAKAREYQGEYHLWAGDLDARAVKVARANARRAGVRELIHFETADACQFTAPGEQGRLIANPPYGERLLDQEQATQLYRQLGASWNQLPAGWQVGLITPEERFEELFGRRADKKRKLYNGKLKCNFYMFGVR